MTTSPDATAGRLREHLFRISQATPDTTVLRVSATKYQVSYRIAGQRWARFDFLASSAMGSPPPGGYTLLQLNQSAIDMPWLSVDHTDASVTLSGAGWIGNTAQAASYGGSYNQNNTGVGQYAEWTAPVGATRLGMRTVAASNEGVHKVTIDGDATRANLLPTAQQLVDSGRLASTALVANGGTFNPTDRVVDLFSGSSAPTSVIDYDRHFAVADGLDPTTAHVMRITVSAHQNVTSSGARLYASGFTYGTATTTTATAGAALLPLARTLSQFDSAYEGAHDYAPNGSTNYQFIGNVHGYEKPVGFTVYVDGEAAVMADGTRRDGAVTIVRTSELYHVDAAATKQADVTTTYRFGPTGMVIEQKVVWSVTGAKVRRSYPAMFPLDGDLFTKGAFTYGPADYTLTANAGAYIGAIPSDTAYLWQAGGSLAALLHIPDLEKTVGNWGENSQAIFAAIEDRVPSSVNTGNLSKVYMTRQGQAAPVVTLTAGDTWRSSAVYRLWRMVDVDGALSR